MHPLLTPSELRRDDVSSSGASPVNLIYLDFAGLRIAAIRAKYLKVARVSGSNSRVDIFVANREPSSVRATHPMSMRY
jgi:hypothetical protein